MRPLPIPPTNVIPFRGLHARGNGPIEQRDFLELVYAAGSLSLAEGDRAGRRLAMRFTIYGLVVIDEVQPDGASRRLRPSEAFAAVEGRLWRVSRARRVEKRTAPPYYLA